MQLIKKIGIGILSIAMVAFLYGPSLKSCVTYSFSYTIKDWEGWRSQLLRENLFEKYNTSSIGFDHNAIRDDFVNEFNKGMTFSILSKHLGFKDMDPSTFMEDKVVKEMMDLKLLGAWREGDDLYFSLGILEPGEFNAYATAFDEKLSLNEKKAFNNEFEYCTFTTLHTHFQNITMVGPDKMSVRIPLKFALKNEIK